MVRLYMRATTTNPWSERDWDTSMRMGYWKDSESGKKMNSLKWSSALSATRKWSNMVVDLRRTFFPTSPSISVGTSSTKRVDGWNDTVLVACWMSGRVFVSARVNGRREKSYRIRALHCTMAGITSKSLLNSHAEPWRAMSRLYWVVRLYLRSPVRLKRLLVFVPLILQRWVNWDCIALVD